MVARMKQCLGVLCLTLIVSGAGWSAESLSYWLFDEADGTVARDSMGGRDGHVHGATPTDGLIGCALSFDGVDDYVALPDNEPVWLPENDFSVAFWVYFGREAGSSAADNEVLVDMNHGSSSQPHHELGCNIFRRGDTDKIGFQMTTETNSDEDLYSRLSPVPGQWHHIAAVRAGTEQMLYIDGQLDNRRSCSGDPIDFVGGYDDNKVNVGRYTTTVGSPRYHFRGKLDELVIVKRALSSMEVQLLHREAEMPGDWYVDTQCGDDHNGGQRTLMPLATIQRGIALARDGDIVNVYPGVYRESIDFLGKAIMVQSIGDAAVLEAPGGFAVSFGANEGPDSVLKNVVITNSYTGISIFEAAPTITNVTVSGNRYGVEVCRGGFAHISSSILWGNTRSDLYGALAWHSCVEKWAFPGCCDPAMNPVCEDPLFVDPDAGDYHLLSERGRYWPEHDVWVLDDVTSPCIDAGDPAADFSAERRPNGGRLNIGAYGGTAFASMSESPFKADFNGDRTVDANDLEAFTDVWEEEMGESGPVIRR